MFVRQTPPDKNKVQRGVRVPKVAKFAKEVVGEERGKRGRGVRVAKVAEEEEDFGRTESQ